MKRPIAYFAGTGRGIPSTVMTNFDFATIGIETTDEWIVERTGIKERHIAQDRERDRSRGRGVARRRWTRPACSAGELDIIVLGTASPDRLLPSRRGRSSGGARRRAAPRRSTSAPRAPDSSTAATVAESMIAAGNADTALVVGVEKLSAIMDWTDRSTCVLFGDGAGAAVLKRSKQRQGHSLDVRAQRRHARRPALPARRRRRSSVRRPTSSPTARSSSR